LFAQKGFAEASTDEVVRRARVTKGALYHHFENKLDLYRAVVEDAEREIVAKMAAAAAAHLSPQSRLEAACRAYVDACVDSPLARTIFLEAQVVLGSKAWRELARQHENAALAAHLAAALPERAGGDSPIESAEVILGALTSAARVVLTSDQPDRARALVDDAINRLLKGFA
jgi:AcrR family transcriptional regulator